MTRHQFPSGDFYVGDCFDALAGMPDASVDMVLCDLPYGTTQNKWDCVLSLDRLWREYWRVCKPKAAVVLTATQPFSSVLGASALAALRYSWVWIKPHTGQLNAKRMPLKNVEDVLVFYKEPPVYNPQFEAGEAYTVRRKGYKGNASYGAQTDHDTISDGQRYPKQVLRFSERGGFHPTQKPVALFEYLIRTYTNDGDLVLDNTAGSGTTAIAAMNAGRRWICVERDEGYAEKALERIVFYDAQAAA